MKTTRKEIIDIADKFFTSDVIKNLKSMSPEFARDHLKAKRASWLMTCDYFRSGGHRSQLHSFRVFISAIRAIAQEIN